MDPLRNLVCRQILEYESAPDLDFSLNLKPNYYVSLLGLYVIFWFQLQAKIRIRLQIRLHIKNPNPHPAPNPKNAARLRSESVPIPVIRKDSMPFLFQGFVLILRVYPLHLRKDYIVLIFGLRPSFVLSELHKPSFVLFVLPYFCLTVKSLL